MPRQSRLSVVLVILLIVIIVAGLYFYLWNRRAAKTSLNSTSTATALQITSPQAGDQLCYGRSYKVAWQVSTDTETVTVTLTTPTSSGILGSFPAYTEVKDGTGYGGFTWDLKYKGVNGKGSYPSPGSVYEIRIDANYPASKISTSTDLFSIGSCT